MRDEPLSWGRWRPQSEGHQTGGRTPVQADSEQMDVAEKAPRMMRGVLGFALRVEGVECQ